MLLYSSAEESKIHWNLDYSTNWTVFQILSSILNIVSTVHDEKFNMSSKLFMHLEVNTFNMQFPVYQMCLILSAWKLVR